MPNLFSEKPEIAPLPTLDVWVCPKTGLRVPKGEIENLKYRAEILAAAESDPELQQDLYTACSQSLLFFVNTFCFTLRVFETEDGKVQQAQNKHMPFITWPIQDRHILRIEYGIDNAAPLLTDKSRDMGATWDHLIVYIHRFLFRGDEAHLVMSRKEETVDQLDGLVKNYPHATLSDPGTLFGKLDYVLSRLPEWMLPRMTRKRMHLVNLDTRTRIDGESSNAHAGSSNRVTSILLDEMAKMKEGEAIKQATEATSACRFAVSTPAGAGTAYSKWRLSGTIDVFVLAWWNHPEKGQGLYVAQDEMGRWRIRSPWYDAYCQRNSPKEVATEVDMDHIGSGDTYFEATVLEQHKRLFARPPRFTGGITFRSKMADEAVIEAITRKDLKTVRRVKGKGPWRIWCGLSKGRPDQSRTYTIGLDLSKGQGASNSVMSVQCNETREKVMEFADANTPPHEMARLAAAAAIWIGGRNGRPLIIWENNGDPGFAFGQQITNVYRYPNVYFDRAVGTTGEKVGKRYGWRSSPEKKSTALGLLRRAYAHGKFKNFSAEALDEAATYIHYGNGGIGPAALIAESESARKTHGDRVIADMLLVWATSGKKFKDPITHAASERSVGGRLHNFRMAKKKAARKNTFDFSKEPK